MSDELNDIEASLRDLGAKHDAENSSDAEQEFTQPEVKETPKTDDAEQGQSSAESKTEGSGTEAAKPDTDATKPKKELSPYEQAKADKKDREAKAWQKIEAEKAALKAEREKLEAERKQPAKAGPVRDAAGYSKADYLAAAKQFEEAGDDALAKSARAQAGALHQQEQQAGHKALVAQFDEGLQAVLKERPEFADPTSEAGVAVKAILQRHPALMQFPGAFKAAVAIYDGEKSAASVPELQKQIDALTKEKERLTKLTALPGSGPNTPRKSKSGDLGERELRALAREHDEAA